MTLPVANILPPSYYDGLSTLWGGCAYVAGAIVAAGLVFQAVRSRPDPTDYLWTITKVLLIGITMVFLREWLMRLNDIVITFGSVMGVDPRAVDEKFITFISGKIPAEPQSSVWDVIWDTGSIGTAFAYAFLWLFGWLSWGLQYIVKLVGGVLLTAGWALSPIFLSFFMMRPMADVARKYVIGLVALVCWPFGWVIAAVVTNAMLETAAVANLIPVMVAPGAPLVAPALTVLLVGTWMIVSSILAPYITTRILLSGVNPAVAFAQGFGGVAQAAFTGGAGAATAAATFGVAAPAVVATAALGAVAAGTESAARGGDSARTTGTMGWGLAGLYGARMAGRQTAAMESIAGAQMRRAAAAESFNTQFRERTQHSQQPHHPDPNQAAIDIEAHVKS